ncbi:hypothetical protein ITJ66_16550 [Plantibacter sp. VKM Ac-2885]|uniref:hypothetical protein n=1 Tax=Plantibacter sp. VKM Ac-2885 TaxID=2783828 RepID=UPI001889C979|nr:hypothetical protein [Plantibacter sp. VKM Ac-2885]MBF4514097.1 hypothetical protein [Plantibacter sp. VKM Ac-2885]
MAEWDFSREPDPLISLDGRSRLQDAPGSRVTRVTDEVVGRALSFDGAADHLIIPASDVGVLNVAAGGDQVSVFALIRRRRGGTGFIAGMWQEDDDDPRRQYGLFIDLPTYGGAEQVIGHVSGTGGPSAGLPYSRDYSATARMIGYDQWRVIGFTYDGAAIRSFLDGVTDARPSFTERGSPLGEGLTYAKNPFHYPAGLNRRSVSDFTVGAVRLTAGHGNFFGGEIARLAVWNTALSPAEAMSLAREWTPKEMPLARFDFFRPKAPVRSADGGWNDPAWPLEVVGWRQSLLTSADSSLEGASFVVRAQPSPPHVVRAGGPPHPPALIFVEHLDGVLWGELTCVHYTVGDGYGPRTERCRAVARIEGKWHTTKRDLPRNGEPWVVLPQREEWIALNQVLPDNRPQAMTSDVGSGPPPESALSALGLATWGDGRSVELAGVSVFVRPPSARTATVR